MGPRKPETFSVIKFNPKSDEHMHALKSLLQAQEKENHDLISRAQPRVKGQMARNIDLNVIRDARNIRDAFEEKWKRIYRAIENGTALAHLAFDKSIKTNPGIGFILSHEVLEPPLNEHMADMRAEFPELSEKNVDFEKRVLSGEHAFVMQEYRQRGIGKRLFIRHEAAAVDGQYTHRMASVRETPNVPKTEPSGTPQSPLDESHNVEPFDPITFLEKMGYVKLAIRKNKVHILGKLLPQPKVTE